MEKTIKVRAIGTIKLIELVIGIITCLILITSSIYSVIQSRYKVNANQSVHLTCTFEKGGVQYADVTFDPAVGHMWMGMKQTSGSTGGSNKYTLQIKTTYEQSYTTLRNNFYFNKNNVYTPRQYVNYSNGKKKWNFKMLKVSGTNLKSVVELDVMLGNAVK